MEDAFNENLNLAVAKSDDDECARSSDEQDSALLARGMMMIFQTGRTSIAAVRKQRWRLC